MTTATVCLTHGHDYGGPGAWRMCACGRSIPSHTDTAPDPAGGDGCGMGWRLCARCDHIDERHITDDHVTENVEVQPGGYLRQDVPAGLAPIHTSNQHARQETPMVEPTPTDPGPTEPTPATLVALSALAARFTPTAHVAACPGLCWVIDEDGYDGAEGPHFDTEADAWAVADDWHEEDEPVRAEVRCLPDLCWTVTCGTCGKLYENAEDGLSTHFPTEDAARAAARTQTCADDCPRPAVTLMQGAPLFVLHDECAPLWNTRATVPGSLADVIADILAAGRRSTVVVELGRGDAA